MNRIKSVITQVNSSLIVKLALYTSVRLNPVTGQRIRLINVAGKDLLIPIIAHIIETGPTITILMNDHLDAQPGETITLTRPRGNGFDIHTSAMKIGFVVRNEPYTFLSTVLSNRDDLKLHEISVISSQLLNGLPANFEIMSAEDLQDVLLWADQVYFECKQNKLTEMVEKLSLEVPKRVQENSYIFVNGSYGCMGVGECRLCEVSFPTGKRIRLCETGPILRLCDLIN